MFLHPKTVAAANRYVESGPEDRSPSFKYDFAGRVDAGGGILRYGTTSTRVGPPPVPVNRGEALEAMARIAKAGN